MRMKTTIEVSGATDAEQHPPGVFCEGAIFMMINVNRRSGVLGLLTLFLATGVVLEELIEGDERVELISIETAE